MPKLVTNSILHASPTYGGIYEFSSCSSVCVTVIKLGNRVWHYVIWVCVSGALVFFKFWYLKHRVLIFKNSTGEIKRESISLMTFENTLNNI